MDDDDDIDTNRHQLEDVDDGDNNTSEDIRSMTRMTLTRTPAMRGEGQAAWSAGECVGTCSPAAA